MSLTASQELQECVDKCCEYFPAVVVAKNILIRCEWCGNETLIRGNGRVKEVEAMVKWNKMIRKRGKGK